MTDCPFCDQSRYGGTLGTAATFPDGFPVTEGHTLVIPIRHTPDFLSLTPIEIADISTLLKWKMEDIAAPGFNIGMNCGEAAGQTVEHAHFHLIPRRLGDVQDPRGGVRSIIPGKRLYGDLSGQPPTPADRPIGPVSEGPSTP